MPIRKYKAEQIVTLLRQIEVQMANGKVTLPLAQKMPGRSGLQGPCTDLDPCRHSPPPTACRPGEGSRPI